eukprot:CAMPEP_0177615994 /NCGR_PEP_ID=MMETSP0419_2-20121207/23847_1 /TAXON_ID=582737 /ORGANISM="Tetraselmis sp., Strain GSL018" /LENGTH=356 /DNA_ID=CAMNT_0019113879 /DNA_START=826 /DNA_END=1894 /DNA_ORIENTATION=-
MPSFLFYAARKELIQAPKAPAPKLSLDDRRFERHILRVFCVDFAGSQPGCCFHSGDIGSYYDTVLGIPPHILECRSNQVRRGLPRISLRPRSEPLPHRLGMLVFLSVAMLRAVLVDPAADVLHASEVLEPSDLGGRRKALQHAAPGVLEMVPRPERRFRGLDLADGACQLLLDIEPQSQRGIPVWLLRLELFELLLPGPGDPLAVRLPLPPPSGAGGAEGVQQHTAWFREQNGTGPAAPPGTIQRLAAALRPDSTAGKHHWRDIFLSMSILVWAYAELTSGTHISGIVSTWVMRVVLLTLAAAYPDAPATFDDLLRDGAGFGLVANASQLRAALESAARGEPSRSEIRMYKASMLR